VSSKIVTAVTPGNDDSVYALVLIWSHRIMLDRGVKPAALLKNTGLDESILLDPYAIISRGQAVRYYRNLIRLAPPGLGLEVGSRSRLSDLGSMGYAILASDNTENAIMQSHKHYEMFHLHVDWESSVSDDEISHRLTVDPSMEDLHLFLFERWLSLMQAHAQELIGPEVYPDELLLDYPDPGYAERYRLIFNCPVSFNCSYTEVRYPGSYRRFEFPSYDPEVHEVLDSLCQILAKKMHSDTNIVATVRLAITARRGFFPSIEAVAENLKMSSRTLTRKLREANSNYQGLLDDTRREIAEDKLVNSMMSIQQIAEACGFRDSQNFSQAFKRWKGMSPSEYRNAHY